MAALGDTAGPLDDRALRSIGRELRRYFRRDPRFDYIGPVAAGAFGSAHRIRYRDYVNGTVTDYLVKRAHPDEEAEGDLQKERRHLRRFRGAMHLVQLIEIPNNPLTVYEYEREWLILEWLPNGTLFHFVDKAVRAGITRLPNRLLWRFFLCMIRGLCGMSWPPNKPGGQELELPVPGVAPMRVTHNDLHAANVVLGDFPIGAEHGITPILKIIDFGRTFNADEVLDELSEDDTMLALHPQVRGPLVGSDIKINPALLQDPGLLEDQRYDPSLETNLWDIGKLMIILVTLDTNANNILKGARPTVEIDYLGKRVLTMGTAILPPYIGAPSPYPWLDEWLATIIGLCMAVDFDNTPRLRTLSQWLPYAVVNRNANFYNDHLESDWFIRQLCHRILSEP